MIPHDQIEDDEWLKPQPKRVESATALPLLTATDIYELSRVDAIINLQRWWKHRRRHNHRRITELRDHLRAYAESIIQKKRQARIRAKIRDIVLHVLFLFVYTVSSHHGYAHEHLYRLVSATTHAYQQDALFYSITSPTDLYAWLGGTFLDATYPSTVQLTNHVVGGVRIGQLRVTASDCSSRVTQYFADATTNDTGQIHDLTCYGSAQGDFTTATESTDPLDEGAIPFAGLNGTDTVSERSEIFSSMTGATSQSLPSPGYSVLLPRSDRSQAAQILQRLEAVSYVDSHTRAVMIDLNLYNAMLQYILAVRFLIEFPSSGGAVPSLSVNTAPLTKSFLLSTEEIYWTVCNLTVLVFYLYFLLSEAALQGNRRRRRLHATGRALRWSSRNGSALRMLSLLLYMLVWLMRLFTLLKMPSSFPLFRSSEYIRLRPFTEAYRVSQSLLAVNTCVCWWILLLLLRVLKHVDLFVRTVEHASLRLLTLLLCLSLLLYGYASAFLVAVGAQAASFRSIPRAMASLLLLLFGGSSTSPSTAYSTVEMVLFACFLLLNVFIIANLFLVVVWDAYRRAMDDVERLQNANDQFNLPLEAFRYCTAVANSVASRVAAVWTRVAKLVAGRDTAKRKRKRQSVVHAISSSKVLVKSKQILAGKVDALTGLGDKLVKNVAAGLGENDRDLLIEGDGANAMDHRRSDRSGGDRAGSDQQIKLLQGMVLQLAIQNENLQRSMDELRREMASSAASGSSSSLMKGTDTVPTRVASRPAAKPPHRLVLPLNQPDADDEDIDEDEEVVSVPELTAVQSL